MFKPFQIASVTVLLLVSIVSISAESIWGKNYFPNTELTTHEGKVVNFFEDLIKDKIVAINFIYTSCPDVCPLETAQLTRVQKIMGDRVGNDVHFYSISIDPEHDTPEVLAEYRQRFGAKWTFLTGDKQQVIGLRRKLGLYVEGADSGANKNNHNVSMIIGNQKTGRWMTRSPFENPHVLADQLGNWLNGWVSKQVGDDYDNAPELRPLTLGEPLFRTRCASCHSVDGIEDEDDIGPDLLGVTQRREKHWLIKWLRSPDKMIANKDPIALALLKKYNNLPMPNLRLNEQEVIELITFMDELHDPNAAPISSLVSKLKVYRQSAVVKSSVNVDVVAVMNAWGRQAHPKATTNAGFMTLINVSDKTVQLRAASSPDFELVEFHEMKMVDGMMQMNELTALKIASGDQLKFASGGKHLMLKHRKRSLQDGDQTNITLEFASGATQTISLNIIKDH
ncbi:copper chaperone PCu(A)C [Colwellia sp. C1TZA3]|uniref:copper chaperone PCu(A)C n=1 Tax=Colwellia sp. C1TZA3 TaxID=2508879 RepID=UPI001CB9CAED|nr:copper chaperone PCu(A)C [Colwellia sp. C1TZA3]